MHITSSKGRWNIDALYYLGKNRIHVEMDCFNEKDLSQSHSLVNALRQCTVSCWDAYLDNDWVTSQLNKNLEFCT